MIPRQFIDDLIRDADIVAVIGRHVKLSAKGSSHVGLCPFHQEKTPSFNVVPAKGFYHCFGCGVSGSALSFLMHHSHGGDFIAAIEDLAAQLGREVPRTSTGPRVPIELLEQMSDYYHAQLLRNATAKNYLKKRGINKETAVRFKLGYVPQTGGFAQVFKKDLNKLNRSLVQVGLAKNYDGGKLRPYFRNRIMFPITTNTGKIVGFGGRVLGAGEPKYLNSPQSEVFDKGRIVYGLRIATPGFQQEGGALVVEGYMDVVALAQHGINNAVATMGTAATAAQVNTIFMRTDHVVFCFDGDEAGRKAAKKVVDNVMPALRDGKSVHFALLPPGEDPDSYVRSQGATAMRAFLAKAHPLEEVLFNPSFHDLSKDDDAARYSELWHHAAALLEKMDKGHASFMYEELYKQLAATSSISVKDLKTAAQRLIKATTNVPRQQPNSQESRNHRQMDHHPIFNLLVILLAQPDYVTKVHDLPLFCSKQRDADLCRKVIDSLMLARQNDEQEMDVAKYLKELGALTLLKQLHETAVKWQKRNIKLEGKLTEVINAMRKQEAKNLQEQNRRTELADL